MNYRLGVVPFVNVAPLIHTLSGREDVEIVAAPPAELVGMLERGEIYAGTLPIMAYLADDSLAAVPGMGIVSRGRVESIRLYMNTPVEDVRIVGIDRGSLSSAHLVRIFFEKAVGVRPEYMPVDPSRGVLDSGADAVLLIGDAALGADAGAFTDLGEFWTDYTGLPFVYAAWIHKRGTDPGPLSGILEDALETGKREIRIVAERAAASAGMDADIVEKYLTKNIHYDIGLAEAEGVRRFQGYLFDMGLLGVRRAVAL